MLAVMSSMTKMFEMVSVEEEGEGGEKDGSQQIDNQIVQVNADEIVLGDEDDDEYNEDEEDEDADDDAIVTRMEEDLGEIISKEDLYPWFNVIFIAAVVGTIEFIPLFFLGISINYKFQLIDEVLQSRGLLMMTIGNVAFSIGCVVTAALATRVVPCTAGSGVPALIAYLYNGRKTDKDIFTAKMVLVKMCGVVLAIVGGLAVGREGPAIHIGAAIGDLTNRLINKCIRLYTGKKVPFSGSVKSNVVMMGATCGFASAFRSPVGGMLYCLEEIATHWDIKSHLSVGAQTFVAAAIASFVTQVIVVLTSKKGQISFSSIIIFSEEETNEGEAKAAFEYQDIPGFILTAIICGILAGVVTRIDHRIRLLKAKLNPPTDNMCVKVARLVRDATLIAFVTTMCFSLVPLIYTQCRPEPVSNDDHADDDHRRFLGGGGGDRSYVQYTCDDGYYSQLASLSLGGEEGVIRHLLSRDGERFTLATLFIFFAFYIPISVSNRTLPIPMGSFVPNLLIGSLVGRIVGEIMHNIYPSDVVLSRPGVFALLGAASMLGAWTRTMMAVVVTLLEVSGDIGMVSPLIVGIVIARSIATMIADHSYTHEIFYAVVDSYDDGGPLVLHPNDWKPQKKLTLHDDQSPDPTRRGSIGSVDENGERKEVMLATPSTKPRKSRASTFGFGAVYNSEYSPVRNNFFHRVLSHISDHGHDKPSNENDTVGEEEEEKKDKPKPKGKAGRRQSVFF